MVHSPITIVTTCEDMQDPVPPELDAVYSSQGAKFVYVGPLLDQQGSRRAAGHKFAQFAHSDSAQRRHEIRQQMFWRSCVMPGMPAD